MRINIIVKVPSLEKEFDLSVPDFLPIEQVAALMAKGAEEMSNNSFRASGEEYLCAENYDMPLDHRKTLSDYRIENGDKLYLL